MKKNYFIIPVLIVLLLSMFVFRYKRYDQLLVYKGYSVHQRYDRLRREREIYHRDKWVFVDDWKREIENILKETEKKRKDRPPSTIDPTKLSQEVIDIVNQGKGGSL